MHANLDKLTYFNTLICHIYRKWRAHLCENCLWCNSWSIKFEWIKNSIINYRKTYYKLTFLFIRSEKIGFLVSWIELWLSIEVINFTEVYLQNELTFIINFNQELLDNLTPKIRRTNQSGPLIGKESHKLDQNVIIQHLL